MEPIRVMIVDDHPLVRKGLRELFETQPDIQVIGEAGDGKEAMALIGKLNPEILLLDFSLPHADGLKLLKNIAQFYPETQVVILSMYGIEGFAGQALSCGARGVVLKGEPSHILLTAIRRVYQGKNFLSPKLKKPLSGC